MIKHVVSWKLKAMAHGVSKLENARKIRSLLEELNGKIPGLIKMEVGADFSGTPDSSDLVLYSEFSDRASLEAYQNHPLHEAAKVYIAECRSERRVVDYEVAAKA